MPIEGLNRVYETGGFGEVNNKTIRYCAYECQPSNSFGEDILLQALNQPGFSPVMSDCYPDERDMLIELCNLHLSIAKRTLAGSAKIIAEWCTQHIYPYYISNRNPKVNMINEFSLSCKQMVAELKGIYINTIAVFTLKHLMAGELSEARNLFSLVAEEFEENLCDNWKAADQRSRKIIANELVKNFPYLGVKPQYDLNTGKVMFLPYLRSIFDSAYYALYRLVPVDSDAAGKSGGKMTIAFCTTCGAMFIKSGNRKKYCHRPECQSSRISRKSRDYSYRQVLGKVI